MDLVSRFINSVEEGLVQVYRRGGEGTKWGWVRPRCPEWNVTQESTINILMTSLFQGGTKNFKYHRQRKNYRSIVAIKSNTF